MRDIERRLADQYPGLTESEQKSLAIEVYNLEKQWQQDPFSRPRIQLASSGGITSDVPLLTMPSSQSHAISIIMHRYENSTSILSARGGELIGVVDNSRLLNQPDINILIGTSSKTSIRSRQDIHHNVNVDMDDINLRLGEIFFTKLANESTGVKKDWALNTVKAIRQVQINRTQSLPLRQDFTNESARNFSTGRTSWKGMVFDYMGNEIRWGEGVVSNVSAKNLPLTTSMVKGSFATAGQYLFQSAIDVFGEKKVQNVIDSISNTIGWQNMTPGQQTFTVYAAPYGVGKTLSTTVKVGGLIGSTTKLLAPLPAMSEMELLAYVYQRNRLNQGIGVAPFEQLSVLSKRVEVPLAIEYTGRTKSLKHQALVNNELPRNIVQERLGGYYEGLSFEQIQLQRQAEDLLLRDKSSALSIITPKTEIKNAIWSERPDRTRPQNAIKHWQDHRRSFPEICNAKEYVEATKKFTSNPPTGTLQYTKKNGEIIFYNSESNTFAAVTKDNIPKTMMKPRHKIRYWENKIKEDK